MDSERWEWQAIENTKSRCATILAGLLAGGMGANTAQIMAFNLTDKIEEVYDAEDPAAAARALQKSLYTQMEQGEGK